eukprot:5864021-Heterocapsa_arctica.AAC.1
MSCDTTPGQALSKDTAWPGRKPDSLSSKNATAHKIGERDMPASSGNLLGGREAKRAEKAESEERSATAKP